MGTPATDGGRRHEAPSLTGALDRMVDAAQNVVVDQVALAKLEAQTVLTRTAKDGAMMGVGGILLLVAWVFGMVALHWLLVRYLVPAASMGVIAGLNAVIGATLIAVGLSRMTHVRREEAHGSA